MEVGIVDREQKEVIIKSAKRSVSLVEWFVRQNDRKPSEWDWRFYDVSAGHDCVGRRVNYEYKDEHGWWHFQIGVEDTGVDWDYNDIVVTGYPDTNVGKYRIDIGGSAWHRNRAYLNGGLIYDSASGRSTIYLDDLFNIKKATRVEAWVDWGDGTDPDVAVAAAQSCPFIERWFKHEINEDAKTITLMVEGLTHRYENYGRYFITVMFVVYFENGSYVDVSEVYELKLDPPAEGGASENPDEEPPSDANPPEDSPEPDPDEYDGDPGGLPGSDLPPDDYNPPDPVPPYDPIPPYDEIPDVAPTYPFRYWEDPLFPWSFSDPASPYYSPKLDPDSGEYDPKLDPSNPAFDKDYAEDNNPFGNLPHRLTIKKLGLDKKEYAWQKETQGTITFLVVDENDAPVSDAQIKLVAEEGDTPNYTVSSLSKPGWFKITFDIPHIEGSLSLRVYAGKKDYAPTVATAWLQVSEWGTYVLDVMIQFDADRYLYASTTPAQITVSVYDKNGTAMTGATLTDNFGNTYTDNGDGTYSASMDISNLPVGTWAFAVKAVLEGYKSNYTAYEHQDTFVADGETTTFTLSDPMAEIQSVTINGTETTNYTLAHNNVGELQITINDTLNAGDDVVVTYYPYRPKAGLVIVESLETISVIVRDEDSIKKYGERPMVTLVIPSLQSEEEARQIGEEYLAQYSKPSFAYELEIPYANISIGDTVITNTPTGKFLRKQVSYVEHHISSSERKTRLGLNYTKELLSKVIESLTRRVG